MLVRIFPNYQKEPKEKDKLEIANAFKDFQNVMICGATFSLIRDILSILAEERKHSIRPLSLVINSFDNALELASYPLVNSLLKVSLKPDLQLNRAWIPWTISTSVLTSCMMKLIQTPLKNKFISDSISMKGYFSDCVLSSANSIGFNTFSGLSEKHFPKSQFMEGEFARSTAILSAGNFGAALTAAPLMALKYNITPSQTLKNYWSSVPLIIFDNALYSISKKIASPFLLK